MRIMVNIENASALKPSVWSALVSPENVRNLSSPLSTAGTMSVLLVEDAEYDVEESRLSFPFGSARVLNAGTTDEALFVGPPKAEQQQISTKEIGARAHVEGGTSDVRLGFGDRDCINAFDRLPVELREAGRELVEHIRRLDPAGELKLKGQRFVNGPIDNWVTFQPQPQVREILVTFKGAVSTHLKNSKSARRPYQGFKVRGAQDVVEAKRVLQAAQRKP